MSIVGKINDKYLKLAASATVAAIMLTPKAALAAAAAATTTVTMDAAGVSQQLSKQIPVVAGLLVGFFALTGLFFVGSGIMKLVAKGNPQGGGQQITASQIAIHVGAGTVLLTLAVIILIARNTLFAGGSGSSFDAATGSGVGTL